MILSALNKPNINTITKISLSSYILSLKSFFKKILKTFRPLLIIFRIYSKKTSNIN